MLRATREWVKKAESDYRVAVALESGLIPSTADQVCFHCQQCAEKYLKALLEEVGQQIPKSHDLVFLLGLVQVHFGTLTGLRRGLSVLVPYGVASRYPGFSATKRQAAAAIRWTEKIRRACRAALGLRTP